MTSNPVSALLISISAATLFSMCCSNTSYLKNYYPTT